MISIDIVQTMRQQVADRVEVGEVTPNKVSVFTPFVYPDGDQCEFSFERDEKTGLWHVTDDGDVLMRAGYKDVDFRSAGRKERFSRVAGFYGLTEKHGELILPVEDNNLLGEAFFTFSQACIDLINLARLPAERKKNTAKKFRSVVDGFVREVVPRIAVESRWHDSVVDPDGVYAVDVFVPGRKNNLFVFGPSSDIACLRAAVACHHYRQKEFEFQAIAIYDDESELHPTSTTPLDEVVVKKFSSFDDDKEQIAEFIRNKAA